MNREITFQKGKTIIRYEGKYHNRCFLYIVEQCKAPISMLYLYRRPKDKFTIYYRMQAIIPQIGMSAFIDSFIDNAHLIGAFDQYLEV
jgi:hypothetical protein